jgi:hypothetical protein
MSAIDLFSKAAIGPGVSSLPGQIAALTQFMGQMSDDIGEIRRALTVTPISQPDAYGHWQRIDTTWQTSEQAIIVGLLVSADTSDFYDLVIGNGGSNIQFALAAYVPFFVELSGVNRIPVTRGMTMHVVQSTSGGTAVIKASVCYIPGDDPGQKGVR